MAAASTSSLGPPTIGPGNSALTVGFTVSATKSSCATRLNSEPLSGNTLCHKNNVERKRAIHEERLASVKASLSLSTPRRMDFMDKRLSKNFHLRRHHEQLVYDNLKLLRALEEIHSRSSTAASTGEERGSSGGGGAAAKLGPREGHSTRVGAKRSKGLISGSATIGGGSSRKKLNSLLARKRKVKAALVARENQKMIERMARSKSLYSRDKMRQHRARHQRVLRLRKTDYTAGHLLAAATAKRHWSGGDSRDEGFSYSFEEGRHRHRHPNLHTQGTGNGLLGGGRAKGTSVSPSAAAGRSASHSPTREVLSSGSVHRGGGGGGAIGGHIRGRGTKSAPRLPSLCDVDDIYGGGGMLGSPSLEECREAIDGSPQNASGRGGRVDGGSGSGSRASSSRNSAPGSGINDDDRCRPRPSTEGGTGSRGGSRHHRRSSRQRCGKDALRSGGGGSGSSTGGIRGTDGSVDSLSHRRGSFAGSGEDGFGGTRGGGRFKGQRSRGGGGGRGDKNLSSSAGADKLGEGDDLDKIFNPLAFLDERKGVRVLIQATKPLEVLHHAGETWICFIRIMVKDPFDDQLDIRIIHDREEVCRRVLSLKEANAICQHAQATSGGATIRDRFSVFAPSPCSSPSPTHNSDGGNGSQALPSSGKPILSQPSKMAVSCHAGAVADAHAVVGGEAIAADGVEVDPGISNTQVSEGRERPSKGEGSLNEFLTTLFKEADTEQKGFLTPEQLTSIMQHAELGLTGPELHLVIAEADDNADGTIDYFEFIPLAYNLVNAFRARRRACEEMDEANFELDQQAIHALYDAEFDRLVRQLKSLCKSHDPDGTGTLPRAEFKQCVSGDRCGGLTNIESKLLLNLLPKDSRGNVIYRKLGAGLEQVRFTTLRNTVAEASATDTQKYLMALCREEDAKSDHLGNKGLIKNNKGDAIAIGGKHYSGVLRARQLAKLLLNAPLLSLSRLHVTALMSQAHIVDGMVNYVELVPMISKTIEGMFHPQSLKMRHEIFKNRGTGGGSGSGGTGGGGPGGLGEGSSQQQGSGVVTVLGKSRDDIQRIFVDVLREDKQCADIERLKDPATFERCMASLGLDLEPDTISALWVAADLDSRPSTTFVDVVDFCFNCVLFMEREKEVKTLQRTRNTATRASQNGLSGRATPGAAVVARAEAVAAAALAGRETPAGRADPLLSLARTLVRHAKVTAPSEGKVGLEFQLDKQGSSSEEGSSTTAGHDASPLGDGQSAGRRQSRAYGSGIPRSAYGPQVVPSLSADADGEGEDDITGEGGAGEEEGDGRGGGGGETAEASAAVGLRLRSEGPEATVLLRARRKIPVVGSSGQPIMVLTSSSPVKPAASAAAVAVGTATRTSDGAAANAPDVSSGQRTDGKASRRRDSNSGFETAEAARGETRDMFVRVFWDGAGRDRAYVEAFPAKADRGAGGGEGVQSPLLSLGVRVPTLAIVDSHAALKFAERVLVQIAVQVDDERLARGEKKSSDHQQRQQQGGRLRLAGVDAKSVVVGN